MGKQSKSLSWRRWWRGALCSAAQSTGTALEPLHKAITRRVDDADMVEMDETGRRVGGASASLWVATTPDATARRRRLRRDHRA